MQTLYCKTECTPGIRVYRNRPSPPLCNPAVESLNDTVYLVDDDPVLHEEISKSLTAPGTKVIAFPSASEYLDFAGKDAAACVIINIRLPDLNGLELQSRLAAKTNPPVIFVSDRSDMASAVCAMKAGAIDFLSKPVDLVALIAVVRVGLAQDRRLRQRRAELAELKERLCLLTPREREVLPLVIGGLLNKLAACLLSISEVTLQIHRSQVMRKMQAGSVAELVRMALKLHIPHWCERPHNPGKSQESRLSA